MHTASWAIWYTNGVHLSAIWENAHCIVGDMIYKRCSFECDMGKCALHRGRYDIQTVFIWVRYGKMHTASWAIWYTNGVHLSAIWENTALGPINRLLAFRRASYWTCAVFSNIARTINTVCIFSLDQVTHGKMTATHYSSNYNTNGLIAIYVWQWTPRHRVWYGLIPIYVSHSETHCADCDISWLQWLVP